MPTVLITGANRGLGLEFVRQYAGAGWDVIACCRAPDTAADLHAEAGRPGARIAIERMDVTDAASVAACAARLQDRTIDVLVNNAGLIGPKGADIARQRFGGMDYDMWAGVIDANLFGPMRVCEAFIPHVEKSGQKKIVTLSSTVGSNVEMQAPAFAYACSKAAVTKMMGLLAHELKARGVIAATFCPGHVKGTRMSGPGADVDMRDSIAGMRRLIDELTPAKAGTFTRYNGETVAF